MTERTAACLCGAVQLLLTGEPEGMAHCHCESCRRWYGAPVHAGALWKTENVAVSAGEEHLVTFRRFEGTGSYRKFCGRCGAPVLVDHPPVGMTDIPAVSVAGLHFRASCHTHYREGVPAIKDGLPKYAGFEPAVGGDGQLVPE